jgi:hypothetical protein
MGALLGSFGGSDESTVVAVLQTVAWCGAGGNATVATVLQTVAFWGDGVSGAVVGVS